MRWGRHVLLVSPPRDHRRRLGISRDCSRSGRPRSGPSRCATRRSPAPLQPVVSHGVPGQLHPQRLAAQNQQCRQGMAMRGTVHPVGHRHMHQKALDLVVCQWTGWRLPTMLIEAPHQTTILCTQTTVHPPDALAVARGSGRDARGLRRSNALGRARTAAKGRVNGDQCGPSWQYRAAADKGVTGALVGGQFNAV